LHPGIVRRALANFLANDCMGLAKEIAYSSLLAFFPAIVALVGLLDLLGAYGSLEQFLRPVAPAAVGRPAAAACVNVAQPGLASTGGAGRTFYNDCCSTT